MASGAPPCGRLEKSFTLRYGAPQEGPGEDHGDSRLPRLPRRPPGTRRRNGHPAGADGIDL